MQHRPSRAYRSHRHSCMIAAAGILLFSLSAPRSVGFPSQAAIRDIIANRVERLLVHKDLIVAGAHVASVNLLPDLYMRRDYKPLWTETRVINDLSQAITASELDGLNPSDYHYPLLDTMRWMMAEAPNPSPEFCADFDLLLTDALVRLVYHVHVGKVDPAELDPHWNLAEKLDDDDPVSHLQALVSSGRLYHVLEQERPRHPYYRQLKRMLAEHKQIAGNGGWPSIPSGSPLKPGMSDPRIPLVRKRLAITGDSAPTLPSDTGMFFDQTLEEAVKRFQDRHAAEEDGKIGKKTLRLMNTPVQARIDQILVELERARWVLRQLPDTVLYVNIASFRAAVLYKGDTVWHGRVQVGRPARETPVFRGVMRYLVLNPTWTVPPTILAEDVVPAAARGEPVLQRKKLKVYTLSGEEVDAAAINWAAYTDRSVPYLLRAQPGPGNPLGRVKFMFPNEHDIYLHDTPTRSLFDRPTRTFSSGCIRVEKPLELVEVLLNDSVRWSMQAIRRVIESAEETTVFLPRPVPVFLMYHTIGVAPDGRALFFDDVYDRNQAVLKALRKPFRFRSQSVARTYS